MRFCLCDDTVSLHDLFHTEYQQDNSRMKSGSVWRFAAQVVIASVIEDRIQRRYYMVPFSARIKRPQGVLAG